MLLQVGEEDEQALQVFNRALEVNPNNAGVQLLAGVGTTLLAASTLRTRFFSV